MYENNSWVSKTGSRTLFVFIHGILSSSESCWRNKKAQTFWPELVAKDPSLRQPSVFVSGYPADIGTGRFDVTDVADEVMMYLRRETDSVVPLSKQNIIFVCHSQGGIVLRQMLVSHTDQFTGKKLGIVLCASPSWGSLWASVLAPATRVMNFRQGQQLRYKDPTLVRLDREFVRLLDRGTVQLRGMCLIETRGLSRVLPTIVSEPAATRYFPWHRIAKATHGEVVKPAGMGDPSHVWLQDFARDANLVDTDPPETGFMGRTHELSVRHRDDLMPPGTDFSAAVDQYFVGRERLRADVGALFERLTSGRGDGVYWVHGFGGMGKSYFLRRAFLDVPGTLLRCLIDWDDCTDRYRAPLHDRPNTVVDMLDALAYAFAGALENETFDGYSHASKEVRTLEAQRATLERRFDVAVERLIDMLRQQNPEAFPELVNPKIADRLETDEERQRARDCDILLSLLSDEPTVRALLQKLRTLRRNQAQFFDFAAWDSMTARWIRGLNPAERHSLYDPHDYLIDHLAATLGAPLRNRGCVLFIDTMELLSDRLSWSLLRLLTSLANRGARLLTVVAGRYAPDFKLPHPAFAGWHESLKGRLKTEHFAGSVLFTRSDVAELLSRANRPSAGEPALPERILAATHGIPMAVAMILTLHDEGDDVLATLSDWDPVDPAASAKALTQKIIGEVSRRFLLHIEVRRRDDDTLRDVIFLTLLEGEWAEELQKLWWGGGENRTDRLLQLTRRVDFIDGGSIHPEPAHYFRETWRAQPHPLLGQVVNRAITLMERSREAMSRQEVYKWLTTYWALVIWRNQREAVTCRMQIAILRLADPDLRTQRNSHEPELPQQSRYTDIGPLIPQLESLPNAEWLGREPLLFELVQSIRPNEWPDVARACWELVMGYACVGRYRATDKSSRTRESHKTLRVAIEHFDRAVELFSEDIPDRDNVLSTYAELAASYSINQDEAQFAHRAIESLRRWRMLDASGSGWAWFNYGKLLHNVRLYEESNEAYRKSMQAFEADQSGLPVQARDSWRPKMLIAHNLHHERKTREELAILESIEETCRGFPIAQMWISRALSIAPLDLKKAKEVVRRALGRKRGHPAVLLSAGIVLFKHLHRERFALPVLRRANKAFNDLDQDYQSQLLFWLMAAESVNGNSGEAEQLQARLLAKKMNGSELKELATMSSQNSIVLPFGLACIERALGKEPNERPFVHTKLTLLCRAERWDEVPELLSSWLRMGPENTPRDSWDDFRELFELLRRSPIAARCADILHNTSSSDLHLLGRQLVGRAELPKTFRELEVVDNPSIESTTSLQM